MLNMELKMKNVTFLAALLLGSASFAQAGGYAPPVAETAPAAVVADASTDWTGFYAGAQIGGAELEVIPPGFDINQGFDGRHYGLHVGYMRDYGQFVSGVELSYDKLDDFDTFGAGSIDGNVLRGKVLAGYDSGRFLPYAAVSFAKLNLDFPGGESFDDTGFGFGLGAKFMATQRLMLGVEWMTNEFDFDDLDGGADLDLNTFTVSASYRF